MTECVADGSAFFAVGRELRPITGDWHFVVDQSALRLNVQADRHKHFDDGKNREQRAAIDTPTAGLIGDSAPDVDHQLTV